MAPDVYEHDWVSGTLRANTGLQKHSEPSMDTSPSYTLAHNVVLYTHNAYGPREVFVECHLKNSLSP